MKPFSKKATTLIPLILTILAASLLFMAITSAAEAEDEAPTETPITTSTITPTVTVTETIPTVTAIAVTMTPTIEPVTPVPTEIPVTPEPTEIPVTPTAVSPTATPEPPDYGGDLYEADSREFPAAYMGSMLRSFSPEGDVDYVHYRAKAGQTVIQTTRLGGAADTYLEIYNSAGTLIARDDDSGSGLASAIWLMLDAEETILIVVSNKSLV